MTKKLFAIVLLMLVTTLTAFAQTPEQAIQEARDRFSDIKNRSFEMERTKRDAAKRPAPTSIDPILPKIKEDFEQMQKVNINLLQPSLTKLPAGYNDLLKAASEINQRASHLKANLFPAEIEIKRKTPNENANSQDIKLLAVSLDKSISDFVHNSIFQNTLVVDTEASVKAQQDLDAVINVSLLIKRKIKNIIKADSDK